MTEGAVRISQLMVEAHLRAKRFHFRGYAASVDKSVGNLRVEKSEGGEPRWNRTINPQIKSPKGEAPRILYKEKDV